MEFHGNASTTLPAGGSPPPSPLAPRRLVAIPCYNEELAVAGVVLRARRHADAVLIVDDGSEDRTAEMAEMAGAVVVRTGSNRGKGHAVRRAFEYAHEHDFDAVVFLDGDGQHDPDEIPQMLEPVLDRGGGALADVALGLRFGENTEMPGWRRVGKGALDLLTAAGGAGVVKDSQCGFRAFGRHAIRVMCDRLRADGFSTESEQLIVAREERLRLHDVPIHCRYVGIDGSTHGPLRHAAGVVADVGRAAAAKRPMLFVGLPVVLLFGLAVWMSAFALGSETTSQSASFWYWAAASGFAAAALAGLLVSFRAGLLPPGGRGVLGIPSRARKT